MISIEHKNILPNLKGLPYGGAGVIIDPTIFDQVTNLINPKNAASWLNDPHINEKFLEKYRAWIAGSQKNRMYGLDNFNISCYSQGTTEAFDKFYLANNNRRFRCFRGEYMYHQAAWRNYFSNWKFIDDQPIDKNDAVIISLPFSDTGDIHPETDNVLDECDRLGVPVLIDSAFFGICQNINFNYNRDCITDITFSLSKTFPVSNIRIGMRLSKIDNDDSLLVYNKSLYTNRLGAGLGLQLLDKWSADYACDSWTTQQSIFCNQLQVLPSPTVIFGLGDTTWSAYNRGGKTNRLCFSKHFYNKSLPELL